MTELKSTTAFDKGGEETVSCFFLVFRNDTKITEDFLETISGGSFVY